MAQIESMLCSNAAWPFTCDLAIAFAKLDTVRIDGSEMPNDQTNNQRRFTVIELPVPPIAKESLLFSSPEAFAPDPRCWASTVST